MPKPISAQLQQGLQVIDEELFASSEGKLTQYGQHIPDLSMFDAKNVLPTLNGYTSFFGIDTQIASNGLPGNVQDIFGYRTLQGDAILIAFCDDGFYLRSLAGEETAVVTDVAAGGGKPDHYTIDLPYGKGSWIKVMEPVLGFLSPWKLWTFGILKNHLYFYAKGFNKIFKLTSYEAQQVVVEQLNPTYIIGTGKAYKFVVKSIDNKSLITLSSFDLTADDESFAYETATGKTSGAWGIHFDPTGSYAYIYICCDDAGVYRFELSTPWDISTAVYSNNMLNTLGDTITGANDVFITPDGGSVLLFWWQDYKLVQYDMTTPWDLTTASWSTIFNFGTLKLFSGLYYKEDGTCFYTIEDSSNPYLTKWNMSTPWDISTITQGDSIDYTTVSDLFDPSTLYFSLNGEYFYTVQYGAGSDPDYLYEFKLETAWDILSTWTETNKIDLSDIILGENITIRGLYFEEFGNYIYINSDNDSVPHSIYQFNVTTGLYKGIKINLNTGEVRANVNVEHDILADYINAPSNFVAQLELAGIPASYEYISLDEIDIDADIIIDDTGLNISFTTDGLTTDFDYSTVEGGGETTLTITGFRKSTLTSLVLTLSATDYTIAIIDDDDSNTIVEKINTEINNIAGLTSYIVYNQAAEIQQEYDLTFIVSFPNTTTIPTLELTNLSAGAFYTVSETSEDVQLAHVEGITAAKNRLVAWDIDNLIYWGDAVNNLVDFTPSAETRANQLEVTAIRGNIIKCEGYANGFLIYATGNVVIGKYTGDHLVYSFKPLEGINGVIDPRHVKATYDKHYAWTNIGLIEISPDSGTLEAIAPDLTDWLSNYRYPITLSMAAGRFLIFYLQDRDLIFSNKNIRNSEDNLDTAPIHSSTSEIEFNPARSGLNLFATYSRALVYDILRTKWGSADLDHKLLFAIDAINQIGYKPEKDYNLLSADLHNEQKGLAILDENGDIFLANTYPSDSYVAFGKYAISRDKLTKISDVITEFVSYPDAIIEIEKSMDGAATISTEIAQSSAVVELRSVDGFNIVGQWLNILVRGHYHLKSLLVKGYSYGRR